MRCARDLWTTWAPEALEWRQLRQQAAREAAGLREDPRERQLADQVAQDVDQISAW